jgi:hypothetical protein
MAARISKETVFSLCAPCALWLKKNNVYGDRRRNRTG